MCELTCARPAAAAGGELGGDQLERRPGGVASIGALCPRAQAARCRPACLRRARWARRRHRPVAALLRHLALAREDRAKGSAPRARLGRERERPPQQRQVLRRRQLGHRYASAQPATSPPGRERHEHPRPVDGRGALLDAHRRAR